MKITKALKTGEFETFGMSPKQIVELIGFDTIADDCVEDLQHYINEAHWELEALIAEAKAEFC